MEEQSRGFFSRLMKRQELKASLAFPQACIGCGYCASVCRHRAIQIEKMNVDGSLEKPS
jgi:ferredoxin